MSIPYYTPSKIKSYFKSVIDFIRVRFCARNKLLRQELKRANLRILHWNNFIPENVNLDKFAQVHLISPGLDRYISVEECSSSFSVPVSSSLLISDAIESSPIDLTINSWNQRRWDFGYIGTMTRNKNVFNLLTSFQMHLLEYPDSKLLLVCPVNFNSDKPPKGVDPRCFNLVRELGSSVTPIILDKSVRYPGLPAEDIGFFLAQTKTIFLISDTEGEPRIVNEAALRSCRVVVNSDQRSNIKDSLAKYYPISWVPSSSPSDLVLKLDQLKEEITESEFEYFKESAIELSQKIKESHSVLIRSLMRSIPPEHFIPVRNVLSNLPLQHVLPGHTPMHLDLIIHQTIDDESTQVMFIK